MNIFNKNASEIVIGRRVYFSLYGGNTGTIVNIERDMTTIIWDDGKKSRTPIAIVCGVQWEVYDEVVSADEIQKLKDLNAEYEIRKIEDENKKKEDFAKEIEYWKNNREGRKIAADFSKPIFDQGLAAKNIRIDLKTKFGAGVKFSVKQHGGSIRVSCDDKSISRNEIKNVVTRYESGSFDSMSDCYNYKQDAFADVFGNAKYVFVE